MEEGLKHIVPYQGNMSSFLKGLLDVGTTLLGSIDYKRAWIKWI